MKTRVGATVLVIIACAVAHGQSQSASLSSEVTRTEGVNADNQVTYVRLHLFGTSVPAADVSPPPTLTAQCTKQPSGKLAFELFANFGGVGDYSYHRPWMPKDGGLFPPTFPKALITMEFLGYTKVKPVKRQWEMLDQPPAQLRYNTPSSRSSNMEDITYYLQYLKSLPTLRLTYASKTAQFSISPLFDRIRAEPLCHASGL